MKKMALLVLLFFCFVMTGNVKHELLCCGTGQSAGFFFGEWMRFNDLWFIVEKLPIVQDRVCNSSNAK